MRPDKRVSAFQGTVFFGNRDIFPDGDAELSVNFQADVEVLLDAFRYRFLNADDAFEIEVVSLEISPTTGRPHLQCFWKLQQGQRAMVSTLIARWKRACELAYPAAFDVPTISFHSGGRSRADFERIAHYCNDAAKPSFVMNFRNVYPETLVGQGTRSDLAAVVEEIRAGATLETLFQSEHATTTIRNVRGITSMILSRDVDASLRSSPGCLILALTGPTGVGKSRFVSLLLRNLSPGVSAIRLLCTARHDSHGEHQPWMPDSLAPSHKVAVLEEFNDTYGPTSLLLMADGAPGQQFECKGSSRVWGAKLLIITSNRELSSWYPTFPQSVRDAVNRRVTELAFDAANSPVAADGVFRRQRVAELLRVISDSLLQPRVAAAVSDFWPPLRDWSWLEPHAPGVVPGDFFSL